ncbi:diguanylate cyclase, partial [Pseudomonas sp. Env-37]
MVHEKPSLPDVPTAEPPRPAAAATLLALMHAQGEVERLSER